MDKTQKGRVRFADLRIEGSILLRTLALRRDLLYSSCRRSTSRSCRQHRHQRCERTGKAISQGQWIEKGGSALILRDVHDTLDGLHVVRTEKLKGCNLRERLVNRTVEVRGQALRCQNKQAKVGQFSSPSPETT